MLLTDIATHLHTGGIGVYDSASTTGNIYVAFQPSTPDLCIAIYDTGGQGSLLPTDHIRTIQVLVRDLSYQVANSKAWAVHGSLAAATAFNGRKVIIRPVAVPHHIGQDSNKRHEFTINFEMWTTGD